MQRVYVKRDTKPARPLVSFLWGRLTAPILVYIILGFFYLIRPFKPVTLLLLTEARIGEFAPRTDFYLRQKRDIKSGQPRGLRLTIVPVNEPLPEGSLIGIVGQPCNRQLLKMFQRHMPVVRNSLLTRLINHNMTPKSEFTSVLKGSRFVYRLPLPSAADHHWGEAEPVLNFTEEEEAAGQELLRELGIPEGAWFVCFHARDSSYLQQSNPALNLSATDCRNCSIANYLDAMRYVNSCGGYAVRVGAVVAEKISVSGEPQIIDYSSNHRSDFGDIYLLAKCKFFVGCNSGIASVPAMFNVPVIDANCLVMPINPLNPYVQFRAQTTRDIFLPKLIRSVEDDRILTFPDVFSSQARFFHTGDQFDAMGLWPVESAPEDILAATEEMNDRIDGRLRYTEEDEELQRRMRALARDGDENGDGLPRVGAHFLRSRQELLY